MVPTAGVCFGGSPVAERTPVVDGVLLEGGEEVEEKPKGKGLKEVECLELAGEHVAVDVHEEHDVGHGHELREVLDRRASPDEHERKQF